MEIKTTKNDQSVNIALTGRLDTNTSHELEEELNTALDGVNELTFDLTALDYISSAGLRVLLSAQKKMNEVQGSMKVTGANKDVQEIFDVTGFSSIFNIV